MTPVSPMLILYFLSIDIIYLFLQLLWSPTSWQKGKENKRKSKGKTIEFLKKQARRQRKQQVMYFKLRLFISLLRLIWHVTGDREFIYCNTVPVVVICNHGNIGTGVFLLFDLVNMPIIDYKYSKCCCKDEIWRKDHLLTPRDISNIPCDWAVDKFLWHKTNYTSLC